MKYIKSALSYLFKNFLYVFLLALVPAGFIGGLLNPFKTFSFMTDYSKINVKSFGDVFNSLIDFNWLPILLSVLALLVLAISVSLIIGQMENHLRCGKLYFKNMFQYVNNNIVVVVSNFLLLILIWFVLQFFLSVFVFLNHLIFSGLNNLPNVATIVIAVILCAVKFVLFIQVALILLLSMPNMLISGYPIKQSISNSIKLINKNNLKLMLAMVLPFIIIIPLACLLKGGWSYLTNILGILILIIYTCPLIMTSYFELSGTPRYDNRKYYNY